MKEARPEILYSDPVREIMVNPPSRILRWGNLILFLVFVLFVVLAWVIKYPDTIPAPVEITTLNPPVTLITKISGRIKHLLVEDKDSVISGQLLAVMETTASIDEIELLKQVVDTIRKPELVESHNIPEFYRLGELQHAYGFFLKNLYDLNNYVLFDYYGTKIHSLTDEINGICEFIMQLRGKEKLYQENSRLEESKFKRDSALFLDRVIPEIDLERAHQSLIRINIELQQVKLDYSEKSIELAEKRQLLQDYRIKRIEEREKLISVLNESFMNLKAQINIWDNSYILRSPVDGIVTFTKYWNENQSVLKDEKVLNIIPHEAGSYLGRINLKMQRSGKVKTGQKVNIKLSGYPYLEYGMVRGIVKSISLVPSEESYIIELDFPDGLNTLYGIKLGFTQNMSGTAEILTEDLRLLQKLINPFRYLITRNKRYP